MFEELEGSVYENKIYVSELYLPRQQVENEYFESLPLKRGNASAEDLVRGMEKPRGEA